MTKEQAKEYIQLLQAYAEGKTIQYLVANGHWIDWECPSFAEGPESYRIKPEIGPITMAVWVSNNGGLITEMDMSKHAPNWRKATAVVTLD